MRKLVLSAMALAMTVVLVGCGGDDAKKATTATSAAAPAANGTGTK